MEALKNIYNKISENANKIPKEALEKKAKIKEMLNKAPIDILELRKYCISKYGLVDNDIRKIAWPLLLNIHEENKVKDIDFKDNTETPKFLIVDPNKSWKKIKTLDDEKMSSQIDKDVNRSLNQYNLGFSTNYYRKLLESIMVALFQNNKLLTYSQGFNDVCSVFLMVLKEDLGYYASCSISHYFMRDYLKSNFEKGVIPALSLMMKIIQCLHPDIYDKIKFMEIPTFAVSWIITWFSHDLEEVSEIYRLYDYLISNHPAAIIYVAAATVVYNKDLIMDMEDDDMSVIHMIFQNLGTENFCLEEILLITNKLLIGYPVHDLLYNNRNIGFQEDSPIFNDTLQVDEKLEKVALATKDQYIKFEVSQWNKFTKKYLTLSNVAFVLIAGTTAAMTIKHVIRS